MKLFLHFFIGKTSSNWVEFEIFSVERISRLSQMTGSMAAKDTMLWDDSALLNAFNNAMTKYRDIHKSPSKETGLGDAKTGTEIVHDGDNKATCDTGFEEMNKETIEDTVRDLDISLPDYGATGQAEESLHNCTPGQAAESQHNCTPGQAAESQHNYTAGQPHGSESYAAYHTWPSMQMDYGDEHARLVSNYHDLEKQRQEVLQQLYQFNGWNCQATNEQATSSAQWNGYGSFQGILGSAYYPQYCPTLPYFHPYPHCWPTQPPLCTGACSHHALSASSGAGISNNEPHCQCWYTNATPPTKPNNRVELSKTLPAADDIAETILEAVKKATSMVKEEMSSVDNEGQGEMEIDKSVERSSDADVTGMLHAWFSAGFYTARCLSRKASVEKKH